MCFDMVFLCNSLVSGFVCCLRDGCVVGVSEGLVFVSPTMGGVSFCLL